MQPWETAASDGGITSGNINKLKKACVMCIGDIMLDKYIYSDVVKLSPESPVPVGLYDEEEVMLGGSGNVIRNIYSLGAASLSVSVIGQMLQDGRYVKDYAGQQVEKLLHVCCAKENVCLVEDDNLYMGHRKSQDMDISRATTEKTRYVIVYNNQKHQILRIDKENTFPVPINVEQQMLSFIGSNMDRVDTLILSDYGKGVLTDNLVPQIISLACAQGKPVIVDPKGINFGKYRGATVITPNLKEIKEATNMPVFSEEDIVAAAGYLKKAYNITNVLVTRGKDGMLLLDKADKVLSIPSLAKSVFDVSGAGDTVVAVLAAGIAVGLDLGTACEIANIAAGVVVSKPGTAMVSTEEVVKAAHEYHEFLAVKSHS